MAPHNAFIGGGKILNSVLIANECLDSRIRYGESVCCQIKFRERVWSYKLGVLALFVEEM